MQVPQGVECFIILMALKYIDYSEQRKTMAIFIRHKMFTILVKKKKISAVPTNVNQVLI